MSSLPTIYNTLEIITRPEVELDAGLLESLKALHQEENQVIVHVHLKIRNTPLGIRIFPSTHLIPREGGECAQLVNSFGITKAPRWKYIFGKHYVFTLIFQGLPKDCKVFDLVEDVPLPDPFVFYGITRNQTDVYHLSMIG